MNNTHPNLVSEILRTVFLAEESERPLKPTAMVYRALLRASASVAPGTVAAPVTVRYVSTRFADRLVRGREAYVMGTVRPVQALRAVRNVKGPTITRIGRTA